ncbi:MAG: phosphonoacetaldehyde hydrolase [Candidatus Promineifilaceae bacterium]
MEFVYQRSYRGPLQAVVLDWAGTTVDYGSCAPAAVFVAVFRQAGVEITAAEARGPMGMHKKDHIREVMRLPRVAAAWAEKHGSSPGKADVQQLYEAFTPRQMAVIVEYADLIPGTLAAIADFRQRGLKIGSCTGYTKEMMAVLIPAAAARGYAPDEVVCGTDVPAGRPQPWMALVNAMRLGVYPMAAVVKIGDTPADVAEGLNAGMWTIAVAKTGNEVGLPEAELNNLPAADRQARLRRAYERLAQAGAHYVVDGIGDVPAILDEIDARLRRGEHPLG